MVGGATQHRTTARDCNMMPCPTHVLSVWCAIFRPPASTEILQKVAGNYKHYFGNRSLWQPPFGPACCAGRQQTACSAGAIAPLVYPGFFVETMSAICVTCRSHCKGTGVSGAAGRPCLLQAFACWEPATGPHSCTWDVRGSAHSASGVTSRPLTFGSQAALLLLALLAGAAALTLESQEPQVGPICCRALRALFCPPRLRSRLQAFCFRELPGGPVTAGTSSLVLLFWHWCLGSRRPAPVCCRPLRKKAVLPTVLQEQAIGHSFSGDARRPCCCSPLEPGTVAWCWSLGSCRSALFAAGLFVLGAVRRPIQLHLRRLLLAVLKEPSTGPLLSGA